MAGGLGRDQWGGIQPHLVPNGLKGTDGKELHWPQLLWRRCRETRGSSMGAHQGALARSTSAAPLILLLKKANHLVTRAL